MTFQCTFSPTDDPTLSLDPDKQPSRSDVVATNISREHGKTRAPSLRVNLLDEMRILVALLGEGLVRLSGVMSLDTLGILGSELVGREVGSFLLGDLRSYSGFTEGSRGVGVGFGHVAGYLVCIYCWKKIDCATMELYEAGM
jgi:hypothetical protein